MNTGPTPADLLARAAALSYPPVALTPMLAKIAVGEEAWRRFVAEASATTLGVAARKLAQIEKGRA